MADYDCGYCSKSIEHGGKCEYWAYNCPFNVVQHYDSEQLKQMREAVKGVNEAIEKLVELDTDEWMEDEIHSLKSSIGDLEDKISERLENEWNRISSKA